MFIYIYIIYIYIQFNAFIYIWFEISQYTVCSRIWFLWFFFSVFLKKEKKNKPEKCDSHTAYHWWYSLFCFLCQRFTAYFETVYTVLCWNKNAVKADGKLFIWCWCLSLGSLGVSLSSLLRPSTVVISTCTRPKSKTLLRAMDLCFRSTS